MLKKIKSGHVGSPALVTAREQRCDQHVSTKPPKERRGRRDVHQSVCSRVKRTFAVPLPWQEYPQPPDVGRNCKDVLPGEGILNVGDSLDNKDDAFYGSSNDRFFDNPEVLRSAFSSSAKNTHNRHKMDGKLRSR
ncbi:hypothetical protein EK904_010154 [Melospiza melodia maxima]|nr:hypothetical protein EK904_010154 [Melospiza melodia maxima]